MYSDTFNLLSLFEFNFSYEAPIRLLISKYGALPTHFLGYLVTSYYFSTRHQDILQWPDNRFDRPYSTRTRR
jgi:hypothetical protein